MLSINNALFRILDYLSKSQAVQKAVMIAGAIFLGMKTYRYVRASTEAHLREKIANYIVIGFTKDSKLSEDEKAVKAEAIAVRKRLCTIMSEIANENTPNLPEKKQKELKNLITKVNKAFHAIDILGPPRIEGSLPSWWLTLEPVIRSEMIQRISIKYSEDTSPERLQMKAAQKTNLKKQIDTIFLKAKAKNEGDLLKQATLSVAATALRSFL